LLDYLLKGRQEANISAKHHPDTLQPESQ